MHSSTNQHWSQVYKQERDFQLISSQEIDSFLKYELPDAPKTGLDLGCGTGQLTRELYHRGYSLIGVDASEEAVQRAARLTNVSSQRLTYLQADLERDDLKQQLAILAPFGLVTCKLVYAFIKDKPAFLEKLKQMLHPQGLFVVITPLLEDVEDHKKVIAVSSDDLQLLGIYFQQVAMDRVKGLTYFVGRPKLAAVSHTK